jgi:hypothetical protein
MKTLAGSCAGSQPEADIRADDEERAPGQGRGRN